MSLLNPLIYLLTLAMFKTFPEAQREQQYSGAQPGDPLTTPIDLARRQQDAYFDSLKGVLPPLGQVLERQMAGQYGPLNIRLIYPVAEGPYHCVVFIRGAGWWAGGLDSHMQTMATIAHSSSCVVVGVDYYRTPEHAYPTQVHQVAEVLNYLREHQLDLQLKGLPVLFGESAGATIALSTALHLRDLGPSYEGGGVGGLIVFYCNAAGFKPQARDYSKWVWKQYIGVHGPLLQNPAVPLQHDLRALPPMWLGVGADDPLIGDTRQLYQQLLAAQSQPVLQIYPALGHGFLMWTATLEPALEALQEACGVLVQWFKKTKNSWVLDLEP